MSNQPRVAKVLAALLISMTVGAVLLMSLGNNPPSGGAFCLSSYYHLDSVEKALGSRETTSQERWNCIQVYFSGTGAGNVEQLAYLSGLANPEDLNCHFVICNGLGGDDGLIQPTERWQKQWSIMPDQTWYGTPTTVRICLVADGKTTKATNFQIKRTEALVEKLVHKYNVAARSVYYPADWR